MLTIRLKRHTDSSASLTCTRADGSVTWQRQKPSLALVFPSHDLTHYAVETTLGYQRGFFGLLADGWEIADFAAPWPRGAIPIEAREVEVLVGLFDGMRRGRESWTTEEFNAQAQQVIADGKFTGMNPPSLTDDDIARVKTLRDSLIARWIATSPGEAMELVFGEREG
jgi:hypothetical protein